MKTIKHLRTGVPNINQFLENNPAPAPASDNSDYIDYPELLEENTDTDQVKDTQ